MESSQSVFKFSHELTNIVQIKFGEIMLLVTKFPRQTWIEGLRRCNVMFGWKHKGHTCASYKANFFSSIDVQIDLSQHPWALGDILQTKIQKSDVSRLRPISREWWEDPWIWLSCKSFSLQESPDLYFSEVEKIYILNSECKFSQVILKQLLLSCLRWAGAWDLIVLWLNFKRGKPVTVPLTN